MIRERALKTVLVVVGLLFLAGIYPVVMDLWQANAPDSGDDMMLSLYVTLGIFLLIAVRNPAANRNVIAFAAWSSFAHASVMAIMAFRDASAREHLVGVALFVAIGIPLAVLAPAEATSRAAIGPVPQA